jgi:hypothetical protein
LPLEVLTLLWCGSFSKKLLVVSTSLSKTLLKLAGFSKIGFNRTSFIKILLCKFHQRYRTCRRALASWPIFNLLHLKAFQSRLGRARRPSDWIVINVCLPDLQNPTPMSYVSYWYISTCKQMILPGLDREEVSDGNSRCDHA